MTLVTCVSVYFENSKMLDIFGLFFERNKVFFDTNCSIALDPDLTKPNWFNNTEI